jgi:fumarate reductase subunit C
MTAPRATSYPPVYRPRIPLTWWLRKWNSFSFMMREFTAVFVGIFALVYLIGICQFIEGPEAYEAFVASLLTPSWKFFSLLILIFALYHTITWFHLAPQIIVLRLGQKLIPAFVVLAICYLVWGIVSGALLYLMLST